MVFHSKTTDWTKIDCKRQKKALNQDVNFHVKEFLKKNKHKGIKEKDGPGVCSSNKTDFSNLTSISTTLAQVFNTITRDDSLCYIPPLWLLKKASIASILWELGWNPGDVPALSSVWLIVKNIKDTLYSTIPPTLKENYSTTLLFPIDLALALCFHAPWS